MKIEQTSLLFRYASHSIKYEEGIQNGCQLLLGILGTTFMLLVCVLPLVFFPTAIGVIFSSEFQGLTDPALSGSDFLPMLIRGYLIIFAAGLVSLMIFMPLRYLCRRIEIV